jgi:hypothetical protein
MLTRIFPRQADNDYRGWRLGLWLMLPAVLLRAVEGVNSILRTHDVAVTADGIPLDTYPQAAADTAMTLFALNGLSLVLLALIGTVVLLRYRALIPFAYLLMLIDALGGKAIVMLHPIVRGGATKVGGISAGAIVNYTLLALLVIGFALSLVPRKSASAGR